MSLRAHREFLSWYKERFGTTAALAAYPTYLFRRGGPIKVADVWLRPHTTDLHVFDEVIRHGEYGEPIPSATYILDAGAHVGLTSVWLSQRYPGSQIIALEPEPSNFQMLQRNAAGRSITPLNMGLWSRPASLSIVDPKVDTWSFKVIESPHGSIRATSIGELMRTYQFPRIDILKVDIEGSEIEVLSTCQPWIDHVDVLLIELHDRFRPGCREALTKTLSICTRPYRVTETAHTTVVKFGRYAEV